MQINRHPKLMIALIVVAMIGGTLLSIVWPLVWPTLQVSLVLGSMEPPEKASVDERGRYYKEVLEKAIKNKLPEHVIARGLFLKNGTTARPGKRTIVASRCVRSKTQT
jgi:hypothetical protein